MSKQPLETNFASKNGRSVGLRAFAGYWTARILGILRIGKKASADKFLVKKRFLNELLEFRIENRFKI